MSLLFLSTSYSLTRGNYSIGALTGAFTVDRFGRRKVLLSGTIVITCILALVTGLLSSSGNNLQATAGIVFIYLFMVVFSFGWTAMYVLDKNEST